MKVFITKYALTSGIQEKEVEQSEINPSMVSTIGTWNQNFHGEGKDWHRTREGAIARAKLMRDTKLKSLQKSIKKLTAMTFSMLLFCSLGLCSDMETRLKALSQIESGDNDLAIGSHLEVSRYQCLPELYAHYSHLPLSSATNPFTARNVVLKLMGERVQAFGKVPTDFEWYELYHAPNRIQHPTANDIGLGIRFVNLCMP